MTVSSAFPFVGERLCLDFVNTEVIEGQDRVDLLTSYEALARWFAAAQLVSVGQARDMGRRWSARERERTFERALDLRATLRGMAELLTAGRSVPQASLDAINAVLRSRSGRLQVVRTSHGYETRFRADLSEPEHLLVPIAESAADLLSTGDPRLVKKCQNPQCILFFYDTTKNHARRWCSMTACGNRAKVAAHYRRARQDTGDQD